MKKYVVIALMLIISVNAFCQNDSTIKREKKKFFQNGKQIQLKQVKLLLKNCSLSAPEFQKYKTNATVGNIFLITGSSLALIGSCINLASSMNQVNSLNNGIVSGNSYGAVLGLMLTGLAVDLIGLPFALSARKHLTNSIGAYNSRFKSTGYYPVKFNMQLTQNGIGLVMQF